MRRGEIVTWPDLNSPDLNCPGRHAGFRFDSKPDGP